ncbi:MAG: HAMP domain-containing histidine kinase [Ignavibacteriaceae bacterium]|nr:HAMP domain-containing histidine kinase [Ignavibacteriaceae bacterium]
MKKLTWQQKLFIYSIFIAILPVVAVSFNSITVFEDELKSRTNNELILITNEVSSVINQFYAFSLTPSALQIKAAFDDNVLSLTEKMGILTKIVQENSKYLKVSVFVMNDEGEFLNAVETVRSEFNFIGDSSPAFKHDSERIENLILSGNSTGEPQYDSVAKIWYGDIILPLEIADLNNVRLLITFSFSELIQQIENHPLSKIYSFAIFDRMGNNVFVWQNILDGTDSLTLKATELLNSGTRVQGVTAFSKNDVDYLASYDFPENAEYAFFALIEKDVAYKAIEVLIMRILLIVVTILIITSLMVFLFYRSISAPILKLSNSSNEIAKGNFDVAIDYQGKDSIGVLAGSLREMSGELKQNFEKIEQQNKALEEYNKKLEEKVADRTAELKMANDELKTVNVELVELNQLKNEFIGIATHDLRNPLVSIQGFAEIINNGDIEDLTTIREFNNHILDASHKMVYIISNLLDINALEQGSINLKMEPVDVVTVVENCLIQYSERLSAKKITIFKKGFNHGIYTLADSQLLGQVFDNLISNAIKFSKTETRLFLSIYSKENKVYFSVRDEGPGLTEKDKEKLFSKFAKLSARPTAGEHSTGLGLSIVKKLVNLMNGEIRCESVQGQGAEFIVELEKANV